MSNSRKTKATRKRPPQREAAFRNYKGIVEGTMLCIDPSSTTFGYAVFVKGEKVASGAVIVTGDSKWVRVKKVYQEVQKLADKYKPDVTGIEMLRSTATAAQVNGISYRKVFAGNALILAIGAVAAAVGHPIIELSPQSWKVVATRLNMSKSDENDAICIGLRLVELAKEEHGIWLKQQKSKES